MKTIEMYARDGSLKGTFTVDDEDYEKVSAYRWSMGTTGYVCRSGLGSLSRWLMNCTDNTKVVDHIDTQLSVFIERRDAIEKEAQSICDALAKLGASRFSLDMPWVNS